MSQNESLTAGDKLVAAKYDDASMDDDKQRQRIALSQPYKLAATLHTTPQLKLHCCSYVLGAESSAGKTTAARMIALQAAAQDIPLFHLEMDEPGSTVGTPSRKMFESPGAFMLEAAAYYQKGGPESVTSQMVNSTAFAHYIVMFKNMLATVSARVSTKQPAESPRGIVIVDSVWRFISLAAAMQDVPSPAKGVHPAYAGAMETLDQLAVKFGVAFIVVQNTELFPIPNLDGAAGGMITPYKDAKMCSVNDRNDRKVREYSFSNDIWNAIKGLRSGKTIGEVMASLTKKESK